ncbi:MAG: phosphate butyryltransferase [Calditrichaeota bacterium]|nr:phosphate butyryltransferase [Calditrichota bacterium]
MRHPHITIKRAGTVRRPPLPLLQTMPDIIARAREVSSLSARPCRVAVAAAHDDAAIEAVIAAHREGIADGLLFGDEIRIRELIAKHSGESTGLMVVPTTGDEESAEATAAAVADRSADIVMKGILPTSKLLKSLLKQKYGLRRKGLLSHTAILSPSRYPKLLAVTDGGMVIKPTFEQKVEIIRNAVMVSRALGIERPRVAVLTTIDHVIEAFPETFAAAALAKMAQRGQIKHCDIDGPMSLDTAVWPPAVEQQGIDSTVAGQADVVVADSIEEGNILAKSLIQFGGAAFAGVIVGAKVPISLVSRADPAFNKLSSIALAVLVSHFLKR